ncbi:MAG: hypothetical protein ACFCBW_13200 [Candidatus Competibacterales bacterium]
MTHHRLFLPCLLASALGVSTGYAQAPAPARPTPGMTDGAIDGTAGEALAAEATEASARAALESLLDYLQTFAGVDAEAWEIDDDYTLEATDDGYRAVLEPFAVTTTLGRVDLAPVTVDLEAEATANYRFDVRFDDIVELGELGALQLGRQSSHGAWSDELAEPSRLTLDLGDLRLASSAAADATPALDTQLGRLLINGEFQRTFDDGWRSQLRFALGNLTSTADAQTVALEDLTLGLTLTGRDFEGLRALDDQLRQRFQEADTQPPSPAELQATARDILAVLGRLDRVALHFDVDDLEVQGPEAQTPVALDNFAANLDYDAEAGWRLTVDGDDGAFADPATDSGYQFAALRGTLSLEVQGDGWRGRYSGELVDFASGTPLLSIRYPFAAGETVVRGDLPAVDLAAELVDLLGRDLDDSEQQQVLMAFLIQLVDVVLPTELRAESRTQGLTVAMGDQPLATIEVFDTVQNYRPTDGGGRYSFALTADDIALPGLPLPAPLAPRDTRLELGISDIPEDLLGRFIEWGMATADLDEFERQQFFASQILPWLRDSGLGFFIGDSHLQTEGARVDIALTSQFAATTPLGSTGEMTLRIENLPAVVEASGAGEDRTVAGMMAVLGAFSERSQRPDGTVVDSYNLQVTPEGRVILNDQDITALVAPPTQP